MPPKRASECSISPPPLRRKTEATAKADNKTDNGTDNIKDTTTAPSRNVPVNTAGTPKSGPPSAPTSRAPDFFAPTSEKKEFERRKREAGMGNGGVGGAGGAGDGAGDGHLFWRTVENSLLCASYSGDEGASFSGPVRVVAFDLDHTLIKPASGARFPKSATDWTWWDPAVPGVIAAYLRLRQHESSFRFPSLGQAPQVSRAAWPQQPVILALLTNQNTVSVKKEALARRPHSRSRVALEARAAGVLAALRRELRAAGVPGLADDGGEAADRDAGSGGNGGEKGSRDARGGLLKLCLYAATERDRFRKPRTGMWDQLLRDWGCRGNSPHDAKVDLAGSLFVGDAAGRRSDHSSADRDFADNIGLWFMTPEQFFLGKREVGEGGGADGGLPPREFDPRTYRPTGGEEGRQEDEEEPPFKKLNDVELVLFCGSPGAGKSTFYWKYMQPLGYERVNQDILKTRQKCIKVAGAHLAAGRSVAVDNTNATPDVRAHWVDLARSLGGVPVRALVFSVPSALARHNDAVRAAVMEEEKERELRDGVGNEKKKKEGNGTSNKRDNAPRSSSGSSNSAVDPTSGPKRDGNKDPAKASTNTNTNANANVSLLNALNPERRPALPPVAFGDFAKRWVPPDAGKEGLADVREVRFRFLGGEEEWKVWGQFWVG